MADVVVVGAGVGGLCAAIRLAAAGHHVRVLERAAEPGGKLGTATREGFSFDTGPSLLTLPGLFDDVLRLAGTSLDAEVDLVRLDPQFRYHWPDGSGVVVHDDPLRTATAMDALAVGAGHQYRSFLARGERIWEVSRRTFLAGPMSGPLSLARRLRTPSDLAAIDAHVTLAARARRTFTDARLAQWAGRYATYSGSSPYAAPATLGCIAHIEASEGTWHPMGGMGRLRDALVSAAVAAGVTIELGAEVTRIETAGGSVSAVRLATGGPIRAGVVIADVDAQHLYRDLLPDRRLLARVDRAPRSTSAVVLLAGVRGRTAGIGHHNVWFSGDDAAEFRQITRESRLADDPTIYACVSAVTDAGQAPAGDENWFVLVNAPAGAPVEPGTCRDHILATLAAHGVDLRPRLRFTDAITPRDLAARYRSAGGAIYGTSSDGRRAAFLRPGNRGPRRGLYLVGGSSHPGGGLPLVAMGATLVTDLVAEDGWSVRLTLRRLARASLVLARIGTTGVVVARLARAARPPAGPVALRPVPPPVGMITGPGASGPGPPISVVIPARNEEARIGPLLAALAADPTVGEVLVVDDESTDATAAVAANAGATVVPGAALPPGWVGKPWALQQGLRQARGEWIVAMDADVEPAVGLAAAVVSSALAGRWDVVSVAGRFVCPTPALRWLHPALLTTLVYRFGPPGVPPRRPSRAIANGQCLAVRRGPLLEAGGFALAAGHMTDDIALVRALARQGWRTVLVDGSSLLRVRMHTDAGEAWRNWGRSLPMADVTTPAAQAVDLLTLVLAQAAPLPRLLLRRADLLDAVLLLARVGTLAGTASAYEQRGLTYWLSPLADAPAVARVAWGALRPGRRWRGRTY